MACRTVGFPADSRLLSYPKARREAGLRVSWTARVGLEPTPMTMDRRLLYLLSYLGVVGSGVPGTPAGRKSLLRTCLARLSVAMITRRSPR